LVCDIPLSRTEEEQSSIFQNPVPDRAGGACFGDSGGPHLWNDTLILVSVTSWGDANCRSNDQTQRTDIASVLDWLEGFGVSPA
jgi:secreted trypsin-like serine protease